MKENDSFNRPSSSKEELINTPESLEESLYVMKVELDQGKIEKIKIKPDSNPIKIAYLFCHKHNLEFDSLEYLINKIKQIKENIFTNSKCLKFSSSNINDNKSSINNSSNNNSSRGVFIQSNREVSNNLNCINNIILKTKENGGKILTEKTMENYNNKINRANPINLDKIKEFNCKKRKKNFSKSSFIINQTIKNVLEDLEKKVNLTSNTVNCDDLNDNKITYEIIKNTMSSNIKQTKLKNFSTSVNKKHTNLSARNGSEYKISSFNSSKLSNNNNNNNEFNIYVNCFHRRPLNQKENKDIKYMNNSQIDELLKNNETEVQDKENNVSKIDDNFINNNIIKNSLTYSNLFSEGNETNSNYNLSNSDNYINVENLNNKNNVDTNKYNCNKKDLFFSVNKEININIAPTKSQNLGKNLNNINNILNKENQTIDINSIDKINEENKKPDIIHIDNNIDLLNNIEEIKGKDEKFLMKKENKTIYNNSNYKLYKNVPMLNLSTDKKISLYNKLYLNRNQKSIQRNTFSLIYKNKLKVLNTAPISERFGLSNKIDLSYNNIYNKLNNSKKENMSNNNNNNNNIISNNTLLKKKLFYKVDRSHHTNIFKSLDYNTVDSSKNIYKYHKTDTEPFPFNNRSKESFTTKNVSITGINYINNNYSSLYSSFMTGKNINVNVSKDAPNKNFGANGDISKKKQIFTNYMFYLNSLNKKFQNDNTNIDNNIKIKDDKEKSFLTNNLFKKFKIMKSLEKIFNSYCNDNNVLDAFIILNRKAIPSEIYGPVSFIVKNCNKKGRFISLKEFVRKGIDIFEKLKPQEQKSIINFKLNDTCK